MAQRRSKPYIDNNPDEPREDPPETATTTHDAPATIPMPGATERKKEPLPAIQKKSRPRKLLSKDELRAEEAKLRKKYPQIVQGTLRNATKGQFVEGLTPEETHKFKHKRSVLIHCQQSIVGEKTAICGRPRRIATSDLAQVRMCEDCTRDERNARKRERRAAAKRAHQAHAN